TYQIVFGGIRRWYDAPLCAAWMGLSEESALRLAKMPPKDANIPLFVFRLLRRVTTPQTLRNLSVKLNTPSDELIPAAFALIMAGWVVLDFTEEADVGQPEFSPSPEDTKVDATLPVVKRWIQEDFERLQNLDFFRLLGVSPDSDEMDIT